MALPKYQPWNAQPQSWEFIQEWFKAGSVCENEKMIELIKHIRQGTLHERLYGCTTMLNMDTIIVSIYDPIDTQREALHIKFNTGNYTWSFIYYSKPKEDAEFVRTYDADKGIEKFDQFIKWIRW